MDTCSIRYLTCLTAHISTHQAIQGHLKADLAYSGVLMSGYQGNPIAPVQKTLSSITFVARDVDRSCHREGCKIGRHVNSALFPRTSRERQNGYGLIGSLGHSRGSNEDNLRCLFSPLSTILYDSS